MRYFRFAAVLGVASLLSLSTTPAGADDRAALESDAPEAAEVDPTGGDRAPASASADPAPTPAPQTDILTDHVDPWNPIRQRALFLRAAGTDRELTRTLFEADRRRSDGFVQPFDDWQQMLRFDRNQNGTIDWFEALEYRQDLRRRILARFDRDRNGRLLGEERVAALAELRRGPLREAPAQPMPMPARLDPENPSQEILDQYDLDGDGRLSEEELQKAREDMARNWRQEMIQRYDTDGDGQLNEEERRAMREDLRNQGRVWDQMRRGWDAMLFDSDQDGRLTEAGREERQEFLSQADEVRRVIERRLFDTDGDGVVSDEERRAGRRRLAPAMMAVMQQVRDLSDLDGDGIVTADEARRFNEHMAGLVGEWMDRNLAQYDRDGDGRLDAEERAAMLRGFQADFNRRLTEFSGNGRGPISSAAFYRVIEDYMIEIGILPDPEEND